MRGNSRVSVGVIGWRLSWLRRRGHSDRLLSLDIGFRQGSLYLSVDSGHLAVRLHGPTLGSSLHDGRGNGRDVYHCYGLLQQRRISC
ncbi:hypothetical protein D9M69_454630 [compost metagenome]